MAEFYINGFSSLVGDARPEDFIPFAEARRLRRMEGIAKNVLLCSFRALSAAGMDANAPKDTGLSVAVGAGSLESTCRFMDTIIDDGDELSSPTAFAGSVHNSTGLTLSAFLHLSGPCVTTGQFDFSFAGALLSARQFLARRMCADALVAVTEDVNPAAAVLAPETPALFAPVLRAPAGPFKRASAAFVLSLQPTDKTLFAVNRFAFSRTEVPCVCAAPVSVSTAAYGALEISRLLAAGQPFTFRDVFAGAELLVEAEPYVKQK